jgi:hypothetical protein
VGIVSFSVGFIGAYAPLRAILKQVKLANTYRNRLYCTGPEFHKAKLRLIRIQPRVGTGLFSLGNRSFLYCSARLVEAEEGGLRWGMVAKSAR